MPLTQDKIMAVLKMAESAAAKETDAGRLADILRSMREWLPDITMELIGATRLGLTLKEYAKHADAGVSGVAKELIAEMKKVVERETRADVVARAGSSAAASSSSKAASSSGGSASSKSSGGKGPVSASITSFFPPPVPTAQGVAVTYTGTPLERLKAALADPRALATTALFDTLGYEYDSKAKIDSARHRVLRKGGSREGPVVYWMSRDQRVADNWALLRAQALALSHKVPLVVVFCLVPSYADAALRAYGFMLKGLRQVEADLAGLGIPFRLLLGDPADQVAGYANAIRASVVVSDFCPLRVPMAWKTAVATKLAVGTALEVVDAHNIVPCWEASDKLEVGARTIRKKIHLGAEVYLGAFPPVVPHPHPLPPAAEAGLATYNPAEAAVVPAAPVDARDPALPELVRLAPRAAAAAAAGGGAGSDAAGGDGLTAWPTVLSHLKMDTSITEVDWCFPGERAAATAMKNFYAARLRGYDDGRNDPCKPEAQSNLSPYLHFGHISAQRIVLELARTTGTKLMKLFTTERDNRTSPQAFVEELVVRRELSDNFCYYNQQYDTLEGASNWAQETLRLHSDDKRSHVYTFEQFEAGRTHEALWNAAQMELVHHGKLHGFMRMYWAKKILEWSTTPEEALRTAIILNDRYSIDGRDPNGYVGCMWAIAGVHDMGWAERSVFGKIRYMNLEGCKRKFNVAGYIARHPVRALLRK